MGRLVIPVVLLVVSLLVIAWFVVGSFVGYAPGAVDVTGMQNLYIDRIVHYGSAIGLLNAAAIVSLIVGRRAA